MFLFIVLIDDLLLQHTTAKLHGFSPEPFERMLVYSAIHLSFTVISVPDVVLNTQRTVASTTRSIPVTQSGRV
jgi:hypothetical protein